MADPILWFLSYLLISQAKCALLRKSDVNKYHWLCILHIHARSIMRSKHDKQLRFEPCFKHSLKWSSIASVKYIQNASYIIIKNEIRGLGQWGLWTAQNNQHQFAEQRQKHPSSCLPVYPTFHLLEVLMLRKEWIAFLLSFLLKMVLYHHR